MLVSSIVFILLATLPLASLAAGTDSLHTTRIDAIQAAKQAYTDSLFTVSLQSEQITDSTATDIFYHHFYTGINLIETNQIQQGLAHLFKAIDLDKKHIDPHLTAAALYKISNIYQASEQYQQAYTLLLEAHKLNPDNTTYLESLAWFELATDSNSDAIRLFTRLNKIDPYESSYLYGLAKAYSADKKYNKAFKALDKYKALEGNSIELLTQYSETSFLAKQHQTAINEINAFATDHPDQYLDAHLLLSQYYNLIGDNSHMIATLDNLNALYPNNPSILLAISDYYKKTGDDSTQTHYALQAAFSPSTNPKSAAQIIRPSLSQALQNDNTHLVYTLLDSLNNLHPDNPHIISLSAETFKAIPDTLRWKDTLYKLRNFSHDEKIDFDIISIEQAQGNFQTLKSLTADCYKKYKTDIWAYFNIVSYGINDNVDSLIITARHHLPNITDLNTKSNVYQLLADAYYSKGNDSIATILYDSCLHYNPKNSGALNNLAYNITKHPDGNLVLAEKYATKALDIDPNSTTILDTYAWILFLQRQYPLSKIYFDKLVRIEQEQQLTTSPEVLYHRGALCLEMGDITCAKQLYNEALQLIKTHYTDKGKTINEPHIIDIMTLWLEQNP